MSTILKMDPDPRHGDTGPSSTFDAFANDIGRWFALRSDGMVLGIFREYDDALRFARREGADVSSFMLVVSRESSADSSMRSAA